MPGDQCIDRPTQKCPTDSDHDIGDAAFRPTIAIELPTDPTGQQPKDDPTQYSHATDRSRRPLPDRCFVY